MAWRIIQVEENKMLVEPIDDVESAIPSWEGELLPVPYDVAQNVGLVRRYIKDRLKNKNLKENLMKNYNIDEVCAKEMTKLIKKQQKKHTIPDDANFLIETYKDFVIVHSCCGTLINDTIGKYVAAQITNETGIAVNMKTDPYRIMFQTLSKPEQVKKVMEEAADIKKVLELSLERSSLFKWRFLHVAKRFGVVSRNARYDRMGISRIITQYYGTPAYEETLRELFLEKLDVKGAERVIEKIRNKEIKISVEKGLSILGENGLTSQFSEVMKPRRPEKEIFEAFRRRLMHTRLRLVCTHCSDYSVIKEVHEISDKECCPKCSSGLIGLYSRYKREPLKALKKHKQKKDVTKDEQKELNNIKRSASLMITYGRRYAMTQAGRGIGTETAARVLAKLPKDEEQLIKYIYAAEKTYAKNKIYWS